MKKYILALSLLSFVVLSSCHQNKDLSPFGETASARINKAIKNYKEILTSAQNGWVIEYYPHETQIFGGFVYTLNFHTDNNVSVKLDMISFQDDISSKYDVIPYGGPTLTFNSYNGLFHHFSTPGTYSPQSLGGDYEFLILSYKNDEMWLKGKKTGTLMRMFKLKKPAAAYMDAVRNIYGAVVYAKFLSMTVNGKTLPIKKDGTNRNFELTANFSDGEKIKKIPYIHTETGIKLFKPVTIDGLTITELNLDRSKSSYVSEDGKVIIKLSPFPPFSILARWKALNADPSNAEAFNRVFEAVKQANKEKYPTEKFYDTMLFGYANYGYPGLSFRSADKVIYYFMRINGVKDEPTQVKVTKYSPGFIHWRRYTHLMPMVDLLVKNSPYHVEPNRKNLPTAYKLTSVQNPDFWFNIKK